MQRLIIASVIFTETLGESNRECGNSTAVYFADLHQIGLHNTALHTAATRVDIKPSLQTGDSRQTGEQSAADSVVSPPFLHNRITVCVGPTLKGLLADCCFTEQRLSGG